MKELFNSGRRKTKGTERDQADGVSAGTNVASRHNDSNAQVVDTSFPDGIITLHDSQHATIDICFVHGLTGNRTTTWTAPGQSKPWPEKLLPEKIDKARILTYGYDAYVVRKSVASSNELRNHANNFLHDLTNYRSQSDSTSRPLIFVAHSLGGLVCKEAVLASRNNPEDHLQDVFNSLVGIAFMGTPHRGSWMADWAGIPASALGIFKSTNKSLLDILKTDDQLLKSIQERFWSMVRGLRESTRQFEVTCFFEELPLLVIGEKVVNEASATLEGYSSMSIHANHSNMVKFATTEDNGFKRLVGELVRWKANSERLNRDSQNDSSITQAVSEIETPNQAINSSRAGIHNTNMGSGTQINNTGSGRQYFGRDQYFS